MNLWKTWKWGLLGAVVATAAEPPAEESPSMDELYKAGSQLFEQAAPDELKEQLEFPTQKQWDEFASRLQTALENSRLDELAAYEPQARAALTALQFLEGYEEYADWLKERLDYIEAAQQAAKSPYRPPLVVNNAIIPHYELWLKRLQARPVPKAAAEILPMLQEIFAAAGLPKELAWLAEVESTFNPEARSPVGACGLFQLMPGTAKDLGLSAAAPDERTDPEKNARAAARYLKQLYGRFNDWPLALAAYNAGPGRIRRMLNQQEVKTFLGISESLPAETRMYVPKVLATLAVRADLPLNLLSPPGNFKKVGRVILNPPSSRACAGCFGALGITRPTF